MRGFWAVALIALGAVGVLANRNVSGDVRDAVELATQIACRRTLCSPELVRHDRGPVHQRMRFEIPGQARPAEVQCQRALWLVGPFDCYEVSVDERGAD